MTLLDRLFCRQEWESFYVYRTSLVCPKGFTKELRTFIDGERYLEARNIVCGTEKPPLPKRSVISKMSSAKKRVVYTYPEPLNTVLKLLTFLLIREYDGIFSDNLYSFRPGVTAKDAVRRLMRTRGISGMYKAVHGTAACEAEELSRAGSAAGAPKGILSLLFLF